MNTSTDLPAILDEPRPETFNNWEGKPTPMTYPEGTMLARCGDVFLFQTSLRLFATVYGLETKIRMDRATAAADFGQACIHQAECWGVAQLLARD